MLSNRALIKICGYGTFFMTGAVLLAYEEVQARIRKSTCYIEAFQYFNNNIGAVRYFGEPLRVGRVTNESEGENDMVRWYTVPLKGPDGKGSLYYQVIKENKWFLSKVELELDKLPGKRFLIVDKYEVSKPSEEDLENNQLE